MGSNLEHQKEKVQSYQEKKQAHSGEVAEFTASHDRFQEVFDGAGRFDEEIRTALLEMNQGYETSRRTLEEERETIDELRNRLADTIQEEMKKLTEVQKTLEASDGRYKEGLRETVSACQRVVQEYSSLLELLEMDRSAESGGDLAQMQSNFQREWDLMNEIQVCADAVPMLQRSTLPQRNAVRYYTGLGYQNMNPVLRGQVSSVSAADSQQIKELHGLLSGCHLSRPLTVYRGVQLDTQMVGGNRPLSSYSDQELVGKLLVDGAFVSTSTRESSAFSTPTMLVLQLAAGTRGAYVGDISTLDHKERELLLDCNQAFRVTAVQRRNGKRYIYATILGGATGKKGGAL